MPKIRFSHAHAWKILRLIYQANRITRPEVVEQTGYSTFLISRTCEDLLRKGFVSEAGAASSTGGRRPTLLSISPGLGRLLGISMGSVNVRIALTDITGNILEYVKSPSLAEAGPDVAIPNLIERIETLLSKGKAKHSDLHGIGVGISGVLDRRSGTTLFWPKLPLWNNVPVKKILQNHFHVQVEVEDTPRTMAFAEHRLGAANTARQFIYVALGAGTGAALFLNGQLYTGAGGFAGEFGHITVVDDGPLCSCGNRGCLETLVSAFTLVKKGQEALGLGLSNRLAQLAGNNPHKLTAEIIAQAGRDGDRFVLRLLSETGKHLGAGIATLVNLLNPELIVIGGALGIAIGDLILPEVERALRERGLSQVVDQVRLQVSTVQEADWARGAALLVAENALERMFLESVSSRKRGTKRHARQ